MGQLFIALWHGAQASARAATVPGGRSVVCASANWLDANSKNTATKRESLTTATRFLAKPCAAGNISCSWKDIGVLLAPNAICEPVNRSNMIVRRNRAAATIAEKVLVKKSYENEAPCEGRPFGLGAMFTLNLVSLGYQVYSFKRSPIVVFSLV